MKLYPAQREALLAISLTCLMGGATALIFSVTNRPLLFLSGLVIAGGLFFWRIKARILYGLIELVFGLVVLWDASGKGRGSFSSDFSAGFDKFQFSVVLIQTFGAIYVLIRGLDNIFQGLPLDLRMRAEKRIKEWHV